MKRTLVILASTVYIGTAASTAYAHHSHLYFYDSCKSMTIEGRVERVEFKDPHSLIVLRLDDGTVYTVDWAGLRGLTNNGWLGAAKASLVFGVRIAVTGSPIRSLAQIREHFPDYNSDGNSNTIDPALIRRLDNAWNWALKPGPNPPTCDGK
jgi:hypothetical protein